MKVLRRANYVVMRLMVRVMPSCKEISELLSQAMDQRLPLRKRLSMWLHVSMCGLCRRYEKQLHLLRRGFDCYADPDTNTAETSLSPEAKTRLEKALADSAKQQ